MPSPTRAETTLIGLSKFLGPLLTYAYVRSNPLVKVDVQGLQATGGAAPQQEYYYKKCLDEELKWCTIGTGVLCGALCWAAGTKGGVAAAIVVGGLCFPTVDYLCVRRKIQYCTEKWIR